MQPRLKYEEAAPQAYKAMLAFNHASKQFSLEKPLVELVKTRASQINGCAYCVDMHTKDARAGGETEQRLYNLSVWRETPFYSERERAALEWTEAVTLLSANNVPDDVYERVHAQFSDEEMVELTITIIVINGWNRLAVPFRDEVGSYQPTPKPEPALSR